jgi:hypothetical protein
MKLQLPFESGRAFQMHLYWVSHGILLLRSNKTDAHPTRIDILFQDVRWMGVPAWLTGVRIEQGQISDIPIPLTAEIEKEAHFMSVFRVISQGVTHSLLASSTCSIAEDEKCYGENSSLLPHYDFRAFTAPLQEA